MQSTSALTNFSVFADIIVPERLPSAGQEPSTQQEMARVPQVPLFSFGSGISVGFSEYRVGRANWDAGSQPYWTFYVGGKWVSVEFTGILPFCATLSRSLPLPSLASFLSLSSPPSAHKHSPPSFADPRKATKASMATLRPWVSYARSVCRRRRTVGALREPHRGLSSKWCRTGTVTVCRREPGESKQRHRV